MRKQWIVVFLAFLILLSGCGIVDSVSSIFNEKLPVSSPTGTKDTAGKHSGNVTEDDTDDQPDPVDLELAALQKEISDSGALLGVAYLGYAELPNWADVAVYVEANGFADEFPFLLNVMEDHAVLQDGGEVYAVVPADSDITLTVSEVLMEETGAARGAELLTLDDGKPVLLRGNISEIVPNLLLTAVDKDGKSVEYSPCLSGMDGSLVAGEDIYDFTPYELVMGDYPGYDPLPDAVFTGTWYARHQNGDNELMALTLALDPDGTAQYSYGEPNSDIFEYFEGTWSTEGDWTEDGELAMVLQMYGGPVDAQGSEAPAEHYEITCGFIWELQGDSLILRHAQGDTLLYGTEGDRYSFMSFDGFHMVNRWSAPSEYQDWNYDLQLYENGQCRFAITEDGGELAVYEGWWYLEDNILSLNMMLSDGVHPETPELEYISGEYLVENWELDEMTLSFNSGTILTLDMEEYAKETFFGY